MKKLYEWRVRHWSAEEIWIWSVEELGREESHELISALLDEIERLKVAAEETAPTVAA